MAKKTCLIITYGPVPTEQCTRVEGGGMRAWGLAKGLSANGTRVTVAVNESFPQDADSCEGVLLTNWTLDSNFIDLINSYDMVIMSYCMGDPSVFVARHISPQICLVLDLYVPIYVEVSARDSKNLQHEYGYYMRDIEGYNEVLKRGDYFMCANKFQKTYYMGVFSALGIINPYSYRKDRLHVVPFGLHDEPIQPKENPYHKLGIKDDDFVVMWFGGLYPWFKVADLLEAALKLSGDKKIKLVFVGSKNPFNPNPDFSRQHDEAVDFAKKHKLLNKTMFFVEWVDFEDRINWFAHCNTVISLNKPGEENQFSWRTRVMDFVWGELAIITNGGDPLSEELLDNNAAIRIKKLSADDIHQTIADVAAHPEQLVHVKEQVKEIKQKYFWHDVVRPLLRLSAHPLPFADESRFRSTVVVHGADSAPQRFATRLTRKAMQTTKSAALFLPRVVRYGKTNGWKRLYFVASQNVTRKTQATPRRYVFIAHAIDHTGAPLVMLQVIREYCKKYGASRVCIVSPYVEQNLVRELREAGVKIYLASATHPQHEIAFQLNLQPHDFVMMNTVAVFENYRRYVLDLLEHNGLHHAYWFIHEDVTQYNSINKSFHDKLDPKMLGALVRKKKLSMLVPSHSVMKQYNALFNTDRVRTILLNIGVGKRYHLKRKVQDFNSINFLLQGTPQDGRKGHFTALIAFDTFLKKYYAKNPKKYRDFSLTFVSIGDDYMSRQIEAIGGTILGERLRLYPSMPKNRVLGIYSQCNAVLCTSLSETFALYVAEAMYMGSFVLRNNSAGVDEQLLAGRNGYKLSLFDTDQIARVIEQVLNKDKTANKALLAMGKKSQEMISPYAKHSYLEQIERRG